MAGSSVCGRYAILSDGKLFGSRGEIGQSSKLAMAGGDRMIGQRRVCEVGPGDSGDCCACW